jgi:hypothetical protein
MVPIVVSQFIFTSGILEVLHIRSVFCVDLPWRDISIAINIFASIYSPKCEMLISNRETLSKTVQLLQEAPTHHL